MEFQEAFEEAVFNNNRPVGASFDQTTAEVWNDKRLMEEPVIEKCWARTTTECTEGVYLAHVTGLYERINPLRYHVHFDGCHLRLWEEGGGMNLLIDKMLTRSQQTYKLCDIWMKLGTSSSTVRKRLYSLEEEKHFNMYQVLHIPIPLKINATIQELRFKLEIKFERFNSN